ncbi:unnamed protein product [Durusdinium trenchii]|uniref:Calmodulin-lysine N-methyltransferase n=1 Tax=Durusdinium trenchii TaxID=1381693 RepID=A0ABP0MSB0_9DINO
MAWTPEEAEFQEADEILSELRRKAETGDSDLPWGDCLERSWQDGVLRVTRSYTCGSSPATPEVLIQEFPYSAHPCSGVGGTGGLVWRGALALAEHLGSEHRALEAQVILEIGAGCGLAGLAAAAQRRAALGRAESGSSGSAVQVVLTDGPEAVVQNLAANVAANQERLRPVEVRAAKLVWEDFLEGTAPAPVEAVDLLIGSDVIWGDRGALVAEVALRLVRPGGALAISAQKGREGLDVFQELLGAPKSSPAFRLEVREVTFQGEEFQIFIGHRQ